VNLRHAFYSCSNRQRYEKMMTMMTTTVG